MKSTEVRLDAASRAPVDRLMEKKVVEALIFIADTPITIEQIGHILPGRALDELRALVEEIEEDLQRSQRGLRLEEVAGGFRFSTRPELAPWIRLHFQSKNRSRLSPAGIETLAVIAYKQPVTAPEIQEIRGVDSQGAIRTLLEKKLVRIAGRKKVVGRPFLYATSREFLMHFGLATIDDLPPIEDFERLAAGLESSGPAPEPVGRESGVFLLGDGEEDEKLKRGPAEDGREDE